MIIDNQSLFSDSQAITATAGSTNVLDTGLAGTPVGHTVALEKDIGKSRDLPIAVTVTEAFNNLTSLEVQVQVDGDVAFGSAQTIASRTYLLADLTLGARLAFPARVPEGANERYLRLRYVVTGTAPTLGKVFAGIVAGRHTQG
jgi:hypothetical protein